MRKVWKAAIRLGAIAGVIGALTIGAREATAGGSGTSVNCQGCTSTEQCRDCCILLGNDDGVCIVSSGACFCS